MKLGDFEVDFSLTNTTNLRKLESAYNRVLERAQESEKKTLNFIEKIDEECNIGRKFFNEVFGEETDKKLFGEENDYEKIMDTLEGVMQEYQKEQNRLKEKYAKYNPNRVKRRTKNG